MVANTQDVPPPLFKPASIKTRVVAPVPALSTLPIDPIQCEKALKALLAHVAKVQAQREETDLLGERDEKVFVQVGLIRPNKREIHKPIRLPLAHPVIDPKVSPVTLLVKDPQREYKDLMQTHKIGFINRVVGLNKLRTKHKTFEAKRLLLKEGEMFLVDDRVTVEVGKCIGKMWREAKKQPIPIAIQRKDLKAELERAVSATYMQVNTGTAISVKIGSVLTHNETELKENLLALLPQLAVRIPDCPFTNIQSIHIKTSTSAALPIYNINLSAAAGGRFAGLTEEQKNQIEAKKAEKLAEKKAREEREKEKEIRRKERSATKEGKGRLEKKRKNSENVEETEIPFDEPITEETGSASAPVAVQEDVSEQPPVKKVKKSKKIEIESEQAAAAAKEMEKAEKPTKSKKSKKA